jgi:hypothetical protein
MSELRKVIEGNIIKWYNEDGTCTMMQSLYTEEEREELDKLKGDLYDKGGPFTSYGVIIIDFSK